MILIKDNYDDLFLIKWRMTSWCNFRCSYCMQDKEYSTRDISEISEECRADAKKLNIIAQKVIENNPKTRVKLCMLGGEIMFMDIIHILRQFKFDLFRYDITSNFSAPFNKYCELIEYVCKKHSSSRLVLNLSLHEEFFNVDRFVEKYKMLKTKYQEYIDDGRLKIEISFVVTNDNLDVYEKLRSLSEEITIKFNFDKKIAEKMTVDLKESEKSGTYKIFDRETNKYKNVSKNELHTLFKGTDTNKGIPLTGYACRPNQIVIKDRKVQQFVCLGKREMQALKLRRVLLKDIHKENFDLKTIYCPKKICGLCGSINLAESIDDFDNKLNN